jgi:glycosyltransferase involved in cell wall biosynthesis
VAARTAHYFLYPPSCRTNGTAGSYSSVCLGRSEICRCEPIYRWKRSAATCSRCPNSLARARGAYPTVGIRSGVFVANHYQAANISIVPSQSLEGFGLTTVESLACGTPVLVTPVGGLTEVVGPLAPSCILCGWRPDQIAEGLDAYLVGKMRLPAAAECVAYVKKHFIWETVAKNVLAIYDDAFRAKHARLWNRGSGCRSPLKARRAKSTNIIVPN